MIEEKNQRRTRVLLFGFDYRIEKKFDMKNKMNFINDFGVLSFDRIKITRPLIFLVGEQTHTHTLARYEDYKNYFLGALSKLIF